MTDYASAIAAMNAVLYTGGVGRITPELVAERVQAVTDALLAELTADETNIASKAPIDNPTFTGLAKLSAANNLTAHAGGGQGSALALTAQVNRLSAVATAGDSVKLPTSVAGASVVIINAAVLAAQVFGASTDTINDVATATGVSQAGGQTALYVCPVAGKWYSTLLPNALGVSLLTAASAAAARASLNIESATGHGDSTYTILPTGRLVYPSATFTAARAWTLPAANAVNAGQPLVVLDFANRLTSSNKITLTAAGSDTINGGTTFDVAAAYGGALLWSDGVSQWSAQAIGAAAVSGVSSFNTRTGAVALTLADVQGVAGVGFTTGDVKPTFKNAADTGWVLMNDGTIGDASSSATTRANADTSALFTLLWNNISNTYCAVSGGRGANAAADFAAHKTIVLPKSLGRSLAGAGAGSGITSRALGETAGSETETPTLSKTAAHAHGLVPLMDSQGGSGAGDSFDSTGATTNTGSAGSGTALNVLDPTIYLNIMIKL